MNINLLQDVRVQLREAFTLAYGQEPNWTKEAKACMENLCAEIESPNVPVAYLYYDNSKLKISEEVPHSPNAFPVYTQCYPLHN